MHCVILGTDHRLQKQDRALRAKIEHLVQSNDVGLIAEECLAGTETVASECALALGLPPRLAIDMTTEQRVAAGIYERLCIRPAIHFDIDQNTLHERHLYLRHADGIREEFWLDRVQEAATDGTVLLICGYVHIDFLAQKAIRRDHTVATVVFPEDLPERIEFDILD